MADDQQPAGETAPPPKKDRPPRYPDLLEDRSRYQEMLARNAADTEERNASLVAAITAKTDEQGALMTALATRHDEVLGRLDALVAILTPPGRRSEAEPDGHEAEGAAARAGAGDDPESRTGDVAPQADSAASRQAEHHDGQSGTDEEATTVNDDETPAAGAGGETVKAGDTDPADPDAPAGGNAAEAAATEEADEAADEGVEEEAAEETARPQSAAGEAAPEASVDGTKEVHAGTTAPAGEEHARDDAPPSRFPDAADIAAAIAPLLPLGEIEARLETIATLLGKPADDAETSAARERLRDVVEVLAAVRGDIEEQFQLIQALHRSPPPETASDPLSSDEALRQHAEVMGHVDKLIITVAEKLSPPPETPDEEGEQASAPPRLLSAELEEVRTAAADLSKQLRAERSGFVRFAWIGAAAATVALPAMLALGIFLQQEYAIMEVPDPSLGWKDRIWEEMGPDIAGCLNLEDGGAGDCVVTVTPPAP